MSRGDLCVGDRPPSTVLSPWRDGPAEHLGGREASGGEEEKEEAEEKEGEEEVPEPHCKGR